jgi:Helicase HerA, central domain
MNIDLGSIQMPINAATKCFAILAKRGAGKTYTAAVLAEEFAKAKVPFVVLDPIDVWWGLRLSADGKGKGLPVVVFGVEHADILIDRNDGVRIAQEVVKHNISCVISTFGMSKTAYRHLVAEFAEELLRINNAPRHVFIEEAHEFVPQRVMSGMGKTFSAIESLVVMGRNRGLGVTLINQRAATVNKDVLTQLDTLLAFQNNSPQDRKALQEWVEAHSAQGDFNKFMKSLPSLPKGEGWIWSPEFLGVFERIKIRKRETFHPDREKMGDTFEMPHLEQTDIQSFIAAFKSSKPQEEKRGRGTKSPGGSGKEDVPAFFPLTGNDEIVRLRNAHESEMIEKDIQIREANARAENVERALDAIRSIVGSRNLVPSGAMGSAPDNGSIQLWLSKLGNGGASRIFKFLSDNPQRRFTRAQIGLAVGLSSGSGSFATYMSTLKRNKLIIKRGGESRINPDL